MHSPLYIQYDFSYGKVTYEAPEILMSVDKGIVRSEVKSTSQLLVQKSTLRLPRRVLQVLI